MRQWLSFQEHPRRGNAPSHPDRRATGNQSLTIPLLLQGVFPLGVDMSKGATKAEEYRRSAAVLRSMAEQMHFPESRAQLMALASSFDALADRVERWQYPPASMRRNRAVAFG